MSPSYVHLWTRLFLELRIHRLEVFFNELRGLPKERRILRNELTSTTGREIRADLMIGFGEPLTDVVILEFQLGRDPRKPNAWMTYPLEAAREFKVRIHPIVLSLSERTHGWAQRAYEEHRALIQPVSFYSPNRMEESLPEVLVPNAALESALTYLFVAGLRAGSPAQAELLTRSWHYFKQLLDASALDEGAKDDYITTLKQYAPTSWWEAHPEARMYFETEFQKVKRVSRQEGRVEGRVEGRQEGRVEGLRQSLFRLVEVRSLGLSPQAREQIARSTSLYDLQRWFERAAVAEGTLELD